MGKPPTLNVQFSREEHVEMLKRKGDMNWHDYIINLRIPGHKEVIYKDPWILKIRKIIQEEEGELKNVE